MHSNVSVMVVVAMLSESHWRVLWCCTHFLVGLERYYSVPSDSQLSLHDVSFGELLTCPNRA